MNNQVIAKFIDGTMMRGKAFDVHPKKESFHLVLDDGRQMEIFVKKLKAVFFVKSFEGSKNLHEKPAAGGMPQTSAYGLKVTVQFKDGEKIQGTTINRNQVEQERFFLFPADSNDNNERILINRDATSEIVCRTGPWKE